MQYLFTAVFTPFEDGTGYEARIPDIPHCVTSGHDLPDALDMIADAASLMLIDMEDDGKPVPQPTPPQQLHAPEGGVTSLIRLDTDRYRRGSAATMDAMKEADGILAGRIPAKRYVSAQALFDALDDESM